MFVIVCYNVFMYVIGIKIVEDSDKFFLFFNFKNFIDR